MMTSQEKIQFLQDNWWIVFVVAGLMIWQIPWKGFALWKAARNNAQGWFVVLLLVNTIGILEILYIFYFSKKKSK